MGLILDDIGNAAVAYSVRKLKSSATVCMRVRRSSDSTEQDIGFDGNELDTAALLTFCGVGSGFVTKWYDQTGNGHDAAQASASLQPMIVDTGTVTLTNSKPAIKFDGTNDYLRCLTPSVAHNAETVSLVWAFSSTADTTQVPIDSGQANAANFGMDGSTSMVMAYGSSTSLSMTASTAQSRFVWQNTIRRYNDDASDQALGSHGSGPMIGVTLGNLRSSLEAAGYMLNGTIQEFVRWGSLVTLATAQEDVKAYFVDGITPPSGGNGGLMLRRGFDGGISQ